MHTRPLRVFVSSRMEELQRERQAIRAALADMRVDTFVFEIDAGARPQSIQQTYGEEVEDADLYVGVFWKGYGAHTIAEFETARALGMDCLIYEKREDVAGGRDPTLQAFLDRIGTDDAGVTVGRFDTAADLAHAIKQDIAKWQARLVREAREVASAIFHGVPSRPPPDFIGRAPEIARMVHALRSGQDLAIEGSAGVGKTTLAIALAHHPHVRRHFRDGLLWSSLGPKADVATAIARWAQALDPAGARAAEIARLPRLLERTQALRDAIGHRRMLLVIDDVWDIDAARAVRCGGPNCGHLITTRDKGIAQAFAGAASAEPLDPLDEDEAYQLLQLLAPEACDADAAGVRELIRAVGGLPQAVRLIGGYLGRPATSMFGEVFPRLNIRAFEELADPRKRLQLAGQRLGSHTGKKTTIEKTIRLSLQGLPKAAHRAFYCLGAFAAKPDRFTPEAAVAVSQADGNSLALLAGRNLLDVDKASRRLSLHPTVADVARTKTDSDSIGRHREHYLDVIRQSGRDQARIEDVYSQFQWAWRQAPDDETLFVLLGAVHRFQWRRGLSAETVAWAERALRVAEARNLPLAAGGLLTTLADAERNLGRYDQALGRYRRALVIWESTRDRRVSTNPEIVLSELDQKRLVDAHRISTRTFIGLTLAKLGRLDDAFAEIGRARTLAEEIGDRAKQTEALLATAVVLRGAARYTSALEAAQGALTLYRELGDKVGEADCLNLLGMIHRDVDQFERALELVRASMALQAELGSPEADAEAHLVMAAVTRLGGQLEEALATARDACRKAEASGARDVFVDGLGIVAGLLLDLGRSDEALTCYQQQLTIHDEVGNRAGRADVLKNVARAHDKAGRYPDAVAFYEQALHIYEELGDRVQQAYTLELLHFIHSWLQQPDRQLACLRRALRIWRDLGNQPAQARVLSDMGRLHVALEQHDRALDAYRQADAVFSDVGDRSGQARALESIAGVDERLAFEADLGSSDTAHLPPDANDRRLARLDEAIASLGAVARLEPSNVSVLERLERLERRRRQTLRFGSRLFDRRPFVPPLVLAVGTALTRWVGGNDLRPSFLAAANEMRDAIHLSMGVRPPPIILTERRSDVAPEAYLIVLDAIPLVMAALDENERLFPGSVEQLALRGVSARAAVNPASGRPAAWVARQDWPILEGFGEPLWSGLEYITWHLHYVMRKHLSRFLNHQRCFEMVEHATPDIAPGLRRDPAALTGLVLILRNLLEEDVPLRPFQGIVETFLTLYARRTERLRILQSVRLLPGVRARLPGNQEKGCYVRLPGHVEEEIARSVQTIDSMPFLHMEPASAQQVLATIRQWLGARSDVIALVVENAAIRRFVRRLAELEFPNLPVISRAELLPGRDASIPDALPSSFT